MKVVVIGLDGATFYVLKPWIDAGYLPNLAYMIRKSVSGNLKSTIPPLTAPAWASFMTGKNPGKHGLYDFHRYNPTKEPPASLVNSMDIQSRTLWQILNEKGLKVGVINVPMNYPPPQVDGFLISGFDAPSVESDFTYPEELRVELLQKFPDYSFIPEKGYDHKLLETNYGFNSLLRELERIIQIRGEAALYLMERYLWDFFMVQFQNTDTLQHFFWEYVDPNIYDVNLQRKRAILKFYQRLDGLIGRIFETAEKQTQRVIKIILSDHGFSSYCGSINPNKLLVENGYLCIEQRLKEKPESFSSWRKLKRTIGEISPPFVVIVYKKLTGATGESPIHGIRNSFFDSFSQVNWKQTKACVLSSKSSCGLLYFNQQGRNPGEATELSKEYKDELIEKFNQMRDPISGAFIFRKICKGEEIYSGKAGHPPDLVLIPQEMIVSSSIGNQFIEHYEKVVGGHLEDGIFIVEGYEINENQEIHSAEIIDLAPTILQLFGLPIPEDMDGKVLTEVFKVTPDIRYEAVSELSVGKVDGYELSDQDTEAVEKRLKALGYLE